MSVTLQDVRTLLNQDELDYPTLAKKLGSPALPHLETLLKGRDPMLASKATYLAALIGGPGALPVLEAAARRSEPEVRVAAASVLDRIDATMAESLAHQLLVDMDPGVRKLAVLATSRFASPNLEVRVREIAQRDPEEFLRNLAQGALGRP